MAESPKDISGLSFEELKALLVQALEENARLKAENAELREEIARLKGLKGRPKLKPSGMEKGTEAFPAKGSGKKGRRGAKRTKLSIDETRIIKPEAAVPGGRSKATKTSSFRTSLSSRGRFCTGASAGSHRRAKRWWRRCQKGQPAISAPASSALS